MDRQNIRNTTTDFPRFEYVGKNPDYDGEIIVRLAEPDGGESFFSGQPLDVKIFAFNTGIVLDDKLEKIEVA